MKFNPDDLRHRLTIADGGWATILTQRGLPLNVTAEAANLQHPDLVRKLAAEYVAAGAAILTTNTFSANGLALAARGIRLNVTEVSRAAVELAKAGRGRASAAILGSIGPSGKILAVNECTPDALRANFAEPARALAEAGVDGFVLETFSDPQELVFTLQALRAFSSLPIVASFSFDSGPQRTRTLTGQSAGDCAALAEQAGADVIGMNCGAGVATALPAVVALRAATNKTLWLKPSVGLPELDAGRPVYPQTPDEFVEPMTDLIEAGANIVGGCCGAGPEHIQALAALITRRTRKK